MASKCLFTLCLLLLFLAIQSSLSVEQISHFITAASTMNNSKTLTLRDYLHSSSEVFPSGTVLMLSPGVHAMPCKAGAVVIRNVSDIALLGSEDTVIRRVSVPGGKDVDIIEPTTVIDCLNCLTGLSFISVSKLSIKRIVFTRCGAESTVGYGDPTTKVLTDTIALSIVGSHNLTLDTVLFEETSGSYSLALLNANGRSAIVNTTVLQDIIYDVRSQYIFNINPKPNRVGGIVVLFRDFKSRLPINPKYEKSKVLIESLNLIYNLVHPYSTDTDDSLPYLEISIISCYQNIDIRLRNVTIHTTFNKTLIPYRGKGNIVIELHRESL